MQWNVVERLTTFWINTQIKNSLDIIKSDSTFYTVVQLDTKLSSFEPINLICCHSILEKVLKIL